MYPYFQIPFLALLLSQTFAGVEIGHISSQRHQIFRTLYGGLPAPSHWYCQQLNGHSVERDCKAIFNGSLIHYQNCQFGLLGGIDVFWDFHPETDEVTTLIRVTTSARYLAFGWGYEQNSDVHPRKVVIIHYDKDKEVSERSPLAEHALGCPTITVRADNTAGVLSGAYATQLFRNYGTFHSIALWTVGPSEFNKKIERSATLFTGSKNENNQRRAQSVAALLQVHGALMGVAWLVIVPAGIICMRYFKKYNPVTFQIHRAANVLGAIFTVVAFLMATIEGSHEETAHLAIGYGVVILVIAQAIAGTLRPNKEAPRRRAWYLFHAVVGGLTLLLGIIDSFLGINTAVIRASFENNNPTIWFVLASVAVGLIVAVNVVLTAQPSRFPTKEEEALQDRQEHPSSP